MADISTDVNRLYVPADGAKITAEPDVSPGVEVSKVYRALPQAQEVDVEQEDNAAVVKLPDLIEANTNASY